MCGRGTTRAFAGEVLPRIVGVVMRWQLTVNREVDDECAIRESQIRMGKAMIRRGVEEGDEDEAQPGSNGISIRECVTLYRGVKGDRKASHRKAYRQSQLEARENSRLRVARNALSRVCE